MGFTVHAGNVEPFQDKFWPQQATQVHTTTTSKLQKTHVKDLDNLIKEAVHEKAGPVKPNIYLLTKRGQRFSPTE